MYSTLNYLAHKILPTWIYSRLIGRWSSTGIKRYADNTLWALVARVFNLVTSFFITIYLIRYLGPTNYGELSYAISFVGLFGIISTLGIDNILYRDLIKYPSERNRYLGTAFIMRLASGALASILVATLGFYSNPDSVSRLVVIILSMTFIFMPFSIIVNEFQANVAQKYPSLITIIVVLILNILKIGIIASGGGVLYIAGVFLLEPILYAILFVYIRIKHYGSFKDWCFDKKIAYSLLIDSWPFIFIAVFMTLYTRIDQIMLMHMVDSAAVGIYDAALRLADAWFFIPAIITSSLFPAIVNAKNVSIKEYRDRLLTLTAIFLALAFIIAIPLSLLSNTIIKLFYGDAFVGSSVVFAIYVWVGVWAVIDIVTKNFLIVENMRKTILFLTIGTALLNTGLNFILIPLYGPAGAAWSTFISYAILSLPLIVIYRLK